MTIKATTGCMASGMQCDFTDELDQALIASHIASTGERAFKCTPPVENSAPSGASEVKDGQGVCTTAATSLCSTSLAVSPSFPSAPTRLAGASVFSVGKSATSGPRSTHQASASASALPVTQSSLHLSEKPSSNSSRAVSVAADSGLGVCATKKSNLDCTGRAIVRKGSVVQWPSTGHTGRVARVRLGSMWLDFGPRMSVMESFSPCCAVRVVA